jgi:hypothetical protein
MIPERSDISKSAKSVFFEEVNDVDIYVEDSAAGYAKLFSIIFSRVFESKYRVNKVFPIGDRNSVISQHSNHCRTGRPSVYVIDGDLFVLAGEDVENKPGLFKLPMYCIENLLCDCEAIIDIFEEEDSEKTREEIYRLFNYEEWVSRNCELLFQLFVEYSISFKLDLEIETISYPVRNFVASPRGDLSSQKILDRIGLIKEAAIEKIGMEAYSNIRENILSKFRGWEKERLYLASGKDYLFPLLKMRAKSIVKTKIPDINLKQRIAKKCDVGPILDIRYFVLC